MSREKMVRSQLVLLSIWSILSLSEEASEWYDASSDIEREPVTWAVDVARSRPWWTHWLMGELTDHELSIRADAIASQFHLVNKGSTPGFKTIFKFELPTSNYHNTPDLRLKRDGRQEDDTEDIEDGLVGHPEVTWAARQHPLKRIKRLFNDPKFDAQWHLVNRREVGHDINVQGVWSLNITGKGVVVAVVDDGVEHSNIDLADNYNVAGSYDLNSGDKDPSPNLKTNIDNAHGTKCAGLIAAVANNSVCGVGVAYGAQVSGLRILDGTVTDLLEGRSFIYKAHINWVYSCSWGPEDNGMSVEGPGYVAKKALELGTSYGRYGYGSIFVFASGNGGLVNDNCNFDGYANSIYTLTVGAVDELNRMPYYAEPCPNTLAVTYSNGHAMNDRTIVTTDTSTKGGCTKGFTGTSAAAPIAAGMVALMLEVRPCLSWRDVQSILIYSAVKVDVEDAQWYRNGAGFHHSDQHGFGLMDAWRLTLAAAHWPLLPPMTNHSTLRQISHALIPSDGSPLLKAVYVSALSLPPNLSTLEYVAVTMTLEHWCRGALEISLQSPIGTWSKLASSRKHDKSSDGLNGWTFTSARFWGETPNGTWALKISQVSNVCGRFDRGGLLKEWMLTMYGSEVTPNEIILRRNIIEQSVANGSLDGKLSCPPLPENAKELELPMTTTKHQPVWEKVLLVIVAVLFGVLLVHLITDFIRGRWRAWQRRKQLLENTAVIYQRMENGHDLGKEPGCGSGEESECEETTLLIRDQITLEEHRELCVQVDCGDDIAVVDGMANCDELKKVEELDDDYRAAPHCCNKVSDAGTSPLEDGGADRTGTAVDQLQCTVR